VTWVEDDVGRAGRAMTVAAGWLCLTCGKPLTTITRMIRSRGVRTGATGPDGDYVAHLKITKVDGSNVEYDVETKLA
jgi:hypothetical protein